ncbi:MAG TPA: NAD-dependent epimerase/dehydratase family protein, partial [Coriobacteriia bacterium]|nr:NAD-dependent epimerase/dehydratase family protein [Coriobacteriia bacterium]
VSRLAIAEGFEVYLLNRGQRSAHLPGSHVVTADVRRPGDVRAALGDLEFDVVVDWIAYAPDDIERNVALFRGRVKQYVFISSASVYEKPPEHYLITESTPLSNPYWEYSRNKIACEERLMRAYRDESFPATIVRPSMTYDQNLPIALGGWGTYTLADRLKRGRPIIVHGDGSSLWVVTHADDLAQGLLGLLGNERAVGEAFHITSDEVLTWNQIYQTIAEALGVEPRIVHVPTDFIARVAPERAGSLLGDKTWSVVFDNSKIKSFVPGFEARIPFETGIRRTVAWFGADATRGRVDETVNAEMDRILHAYGGAAT